MNNKKCIVLGLSLLLILTGCDRESGDNGSTTPTGAPIDLYSNDNYIKVDSGSYDNSQVLRYKNGKLNEYVNNTYDEDGNLIRTCTYDSNNQCFYWAESEYDDNKCELTKKVAETGGSYDYNYENEYNSDGKITEQVESNNLEKVVRKIEWEYNGLVTRQKTYTADGDEVQLTETTVDEAGRPLKIVVSNQGKVVSETEYKYDKSGNPVSYVCDGASYEYVNQYDGSNLISQETYQDGKLINIDKYKYSNTGKCIEYTNTNDKATEISVVYEYDDRGNRTKTRNNATDETTEKTYNADNVAISSKVISSDGTVKFEERTFFYKNPD